jgi:hypothetical protein
MVTKYFLNSVGLMQVVILKAGKKTIGFVAGLHAHFFHRNYYLEMEAVPSVAWRMMIGQYPLSQIP